MVFRAVRRAVWVLQELWSFGRTEEAQLDKLIAREQAKLDMVKKLNKEADEQFANMQMEVLRHTTEQINQVNKILQQHEENIAKDLKSISLDRLTGAPEQPEPFEPDLGKPESKPASSGPAKKS